MALSEMRCGDILIFRGSGWVHKILSRWLKLFERWWDGWGWHMAFVSYIDKATNEIYIAESVGSGVQVTPLGADHNTYRVYRWFDELINEDKLTAFTERYLGCDYDVAVYFLTMLQYLVLHYFNHPIPRLLDNRYTCWEFVFLMCREMGKPIQSIHKYPVITDFLKAIGENKR